MSKHIHHESRVQNLAFSKAWTFLTEQERNYAYFMAKASWAGARMVPHQISYEAPALFVIFQTYFRDPDFQLLEECAIKDGATLIQWKNFIAYVAGVYGNMSNYHSFGDIKFIPELANFAKFTQILYSHPEAKKEFSHLKQVLDELLPQVDREVFNIDKPYTQLNFPHEGGVTGYFSRNMTPEDLKLVKEVLLKEKVDILNTRAFKHQNGDIMITVGSIDHSSRSVEHAGRKFEIRFGEFSSYLKDMNYYLERAMTYAANDNQREMIRFYIEHYKTGSIEVHKDSQRKWIADKGPVVETNMGWIETYIDPENSRAYFEGWVAIVDKELSKKFKQLVTNSE